jgi:PAS domain S-box-containing protein
MESTQQIANLQKRVDELEEELVDKDRLCELGRRSDERFRKIFEHSNDAIFLVDPEENAIVDSNPKASEMLGYTREELLHLPLSMIHPYDMSQLKEFAEEVMRQGQGWTDELTCITKSKTSVPSEISASLINLEGRTFMISMVRDISERKRLSKENQYLADEVRSEAGFGEIVGSSQMLRKVLEQINLVGPTDTSVLISGESGTGKELIARAIHEQSSRKDHTLVRVNCASIPAELFESEFFGHAKGSFTGAMKDRTGRFELADKGTLFLDEIGEVPINLQSKLLRVLQEHQFERVGESRTRTVDVRILAATNADLLEAVKEGRFREDLYYRLSVFPIEIPPLRDRPDDIAPLTEHFLDEMSRRLGLPRPRLTPGNLQALQSYHWPGNVRELQNVIERALILSRQGPLRFDLAEGGPAERENGPVPVSMDPAGIQSFDELKRQEHHLILRTLETSGWKIYGENGAAAKLGIPPTTLTSKMKKLGIKRKP